jgi:hypothetical protein
MTYVTSNQPRLIGGSLNVGPRIWLYKSADVGTTVDGAGYFTDGYSLGMRAGDFVYVFDTTTPKVTGHYVVTANSTTVDLSNGTTLADGSSNSD